MSKRKGPSRPPKSPGSERTPRGGSARPPGGKAKPRQGNKPDLGKQSQQRPAKHRHQEKSFHDPHAAREAQRYEHPIASREAIIELLGKQGKPVEAQVIAQELGLHDEGACDALDKRLRAMLRDGQLLQNRSGDFAPAQKIGLIAGTVLANAEGYGFLRPDEGGEDLYLSPAQMRQVLHGDRVLASVVGVDRRGRRQGAIREVLERRASRLVGRIVEEHGVVVVAPDDRHIHQDILIPSDARNGARAGQIVIAEITEPPTLQRGPIGRVLSVLGERLQPSLMVEMAIASYNLPHEWPEQVLRDATNVEPLVSRAEYKGRVDLRELSLVTIDGADARDFDDAVYAEPVRGGYRLIVAIADVSHYVQPETPLDGEAYSRGTSVYFPGFVVPMLPETLSNGICSLNPDVERLCMACEMQVDANGEVTHAKFYPGLMRSHARLTYEQVWQAVGQGDKAAQRDVAAVLPELENLFALYKLLAKARKRRGAIDFDTSEVKYQLDGKGDVVSLGAQPRNDAHRLIEECMIAANVQAAKFLTKKKIPALYRVHAPPPAGKYEDLLEFLREYKLKLPAIEKVTPADFSSLLAKTRDRVDAGLIQSVLLRSQSLASYQPVNHGHFGLALDAYAHFTSPIRRYPDLLVHRAIRYALSGGKPDAYIYTESKMALMATHCSHAERRAEEAERDVDERYKCAWMEKHVGEQFDGIITGVTSFGLFVELNESKVSGLVHVSQLPNDFYRFDPIRHLLSGERTRSHYTLGDLVEVQVLRASMEDRKVDFRLIEKGRDVSARDRGDAAKPTSAKRTPAKAKRMR